MMPMNVPNPLKMSSTSKRSKVKTQTFIDNFQVLRSTLEQHPELVGDDEYHRTMALIGIIVDAKISNHVAVDVKLGQVDFDRQMIFVECFDRVERWVGISKPTMLHIIAYLIQRDLSALTQLSIETRSQFVREIALFPGWGKTSTALTRQGFWKSLRKIRRASEESQVNRP